MTVHNLLIFSWNLQGKCTKLQSYKHPNNLHVKVHIVLMQMKQIWKQTNQLIIKIEFSCHSYSKVLLEWLQNYIWVLYNEILLAKQYDIHTQRNELIKTTKTCFVEYIFDVLRKIFSWSKKTVLLRREKYIVNIFYKIY